MIQIVRPGGLSDLAEVMRDTSGSLLIKGSGTKLDWGGRVVEPDVVLDSTELSGIVKHNAPDMTAVVRAGTTLRDLQAELEPHGQWLALDPPSSRMGATIGGLVATGDSGPSRLRYGGLRDLVIGATVVLADSTIARSGGQVIKNVAGYDLAKIMYGSLGSLAFIAEVAVRLHPRPASSATVVATADANQAFVIARALSDSALEPAAIEWFWDGSIGRLYVRVDGTEAHVTDAAARVMRLVHSQAGTAVTLCSDEATDTWDRYQQSSAAGPSQTAFRVSALPSGLPALHTELLSAARPEGITVTVRSTVSLGLHSVRLSGGSPAGHAAVVARARSTMDGQASVLLQRRSNDVDLLVDPHGPTPSTINVLRNLKRTFDPEGRLGAGRFHSWY